VNKQKQSCEPHKYVFSKQPSTHLNSMVSYEVNISCEHF